MPASASARPRLALVVQTALRKSLAYVRTRISATRTKIEKGAEQCSKNMILCLVGTSWCRDFNSVILAKSCTPHLPTYACLSSQDILDKYPTSGPFLGWLANAGISISSRALRLLCRQLFGRALHTFERGSQPLERKLKKEQNSVVKTYLYCVIFSACAGLVLPSLEQV